MQFTSPKLPFIFCMRTILLVLTDLYVPLNCESTVSETGAGWKYPELLLCCLSLFSFLPVIGTSAMTITADALLTAGALLTRKVLIKSGVKGITWRLKTDSDMEEKCNILHVRASRTVWRDKSCSLSNYVKYGIIKEKPEGLSRKPVRL